MIRTLLVSLVILVGFAPVTAQISRDDISFDRTTLDFGKIVVEDGIVIATYTLTNNGSENFHISNVDAECGCTNPRTSKRDVAPGEQAVITAEFNPAGMIGQVSKKVTVRGNLRDSYEIVLRFKATVSSETERNPNSYYPGEFGYLLLSKFHFDFGNQFTNFIGKDSIVMSNDGYKDIIIKEIKGLPSFMKISDLPLTVKPKEIKTLYVNIDTRNIDTIGEYSGTLDVTTTDKFFAKKQFTYYINFAYDFSQMSRRQKRKAPKLELSTDYVALGWMKAGTKKSAPVTISNSGKSPLVIKRVVTDCNCAILSGLKNELAPGESISVQVQFDSVLKKGKQTKGITLYTNDPLNSMKVIRVNANVN